MDIKNYTDALNARQTELADYIGQNLKSIAVPTSYEAVEIRKTNFLTKSGWTFNVTGVIALIAGLLVGASAIWISGCAAILAGCYCIVKGKQQLRAEAFDSIDETVMSGIDKVVAHVSKDWTEFVADQNRRLRADIVGAPIADADKVKALGFMTCASHFHADTDRLRSEIAKIGDDGSIAGYRAWLPKAASQLEEALALAAKAQGDVYSGVAGVTAATPSASTVAAG